MDFKPKVNQLSYGLKRFEWKAWSNLKPVHFVRVVAGKSCILVFVCALFHQFTRFYLNVTFRPLHVEHVPLRTGFDLRAMGVI